jgi:Endonuclease-reverse transcriptase
MNYAPSRRHTLKFLQTNLRHGRLAAANFAQTLLELDIDIALIQEPYAASDKGTLPPRIPFLPDAYHALHRLDAHHHFGAAIVAKKSLKCSLLPDHSQNHFASALVEFDSSPILIRSLYLRPSLPSLEAELSPLLTHSPIPLPRSIIGADTNAKSPLWNSPCYNTRGRELEALLSNLPLNVANPVLSLLPFSPPETQFIDITLVGDAVPVHNWHYLDTPTLSDHPYIYFELVCNAQRPSKPVRIFNSLPSPVNLDKGKFIAHLRTSVAQNELEVPPLKRSFIGLDRRSGETSC